MNAMSRANLSSNAGSALSGARVTCACRGPKGQEGALSTVLNIGDQHGDGKDKGVGTFSDRRSLAPRTEFDKGGCPPASV